ncbi:hypothetical protein E3A20_26150, partial [Planctomyces bekefii]
QDATYGQDTQRQIDRIKDVSGQLGMSPWELNGGSASSPLPAQQFMSGQTKNTRDADPSGQLIATQQMRTQKDIAAMQAATQLATTGMQTGNQRFLATQTPGAELQRAQTKESTARESLIQLQKDLTNAQEANTVANTTATINDAMVKRATAIIAALPKNTFNVGAFQRTETAGADKVINWMQGKQDQQELEQIIRTYTPQDLNNSIDRLIQATAKTANQAMDAASNVAGSINNF